MKILDHGSLTLVEAWGGDEQIVEAARMSTGKGFLGWGPKACSKCVGEQHDPNCGVKWMSSGALISPCTCRRPLGCDCGATGIVLGDEKLLRYLWTHKHTSPFEQVGATFEVEAPIFVFREWHRHRTQSYNEMSARYTSLPDKNYLPERCRCNPTLSENRQAQGHRKLPGTLTEVEVDAWLDDLERVYKHAQTIYDRGLDMGIPKELARLPVPVARYSRMRASANLLNWLRFLRLRTSPEAQWEIRQYAEGLQSLLAERFPRTLELFAEGGL